MDYVLFGMGYGASLMLLGWALRTFGPQLKYSRSPHENEVDFQVEQRFWVRFIQGLGGVVAIAGTTMVLMTFVVVLVNPDDDTGGMIALAIWAFITVALMVWCWMYVRHYGLTGVWSRSDGYGLRKPSAPRTGQRLGKQSAVSPMSSTMRPGSVEDGVPGTEGTAEPDPDSIETQASGATESLPDEVPGPESEEAVSNPEVAAVYDFGDVDDATVPSDGGGRSEALRRLRERQARARKLQG